MNYNPTYKSLPFERSPKNQEESDRYANALSKGNYPVGLDGCFTVGDSGGCGIDCFVYQNGDCKEPDSFLENKHKTMVDEELEEHYYLYPNSLYGSGKLTLNK